MESRDPVLKKMTSLSYRFETPISVDVMHWGKWPKTNYIAVTFHGYSPNYTPKSKFVVSMDQMTLSLVVPSDDIDTPTLVDLTTNLGIYKMAPGYRTWIVSKIEDILENN